MNALDGKVAIVSGAARRLRIALVSLLAQAGARISLTDIAAPEREAQQLLTELGNIASFCRHDVSREKLWERRGWRGATGDFAAWTFDR